MGQFTTLTPLTYLLPITRSLFFNSFIIAGDGNVIEPDGQVVAIGSGGGFAQAAALALISKTKLSAKQIAFESLKIAADLCIYTNNSISVLEIK